MNTKSRVPAIDGFSREYPDFNNQAGRALRARRKGMERRAQKYYMLVGRRGSAGLKDCSSTRPLFSEMFSNCLC